MVLLYCQVQEVVKMMEMELGEEWIFHKHCKVIGLSTLCLH